MIKMTIILLPMEIDSVEKEESNWKEDYKIMDSSKIAKYIFR